MAALRRLRPSAVRKLRSFIVGFANVPYPALCCLSPSVSVREESAKSGRSESRARLEVDANLASNPRQLLLWNGALQMLQQVFLPGLSKDHAIDRKRMAQCRQSRRFAAKRQCWDMALNVRSIIDREDPVGNDLGLLVEVLLSVFEKAWPRVCPRRGRICVLRRQARHILSHRVALIAMNASFALLQVHGVAWQIPMNNRMAVGMEIQPFLADGSCRKDERPERRVEGGAHRFFAKLRFFSLAAPFVAITHRKARPCPLIVNGQ